MRVLVTGGAGFIGHHVIHELLARGAEVRVLDSFVSGSRYTLPVTAEIIEGDIRDTVLIEKAMEGVSHVVHLAALVSVPISFEKPEETYSINVDGTRLIMDAAVRHNVTRMVYASSAAVYGDDPVLPKQEDMVCKPQSPYAESKFKNEQTALMYAGSASTAIGLRFFNVYGPGQSGNHPYASVIPRWIEALQEGRALQIYGDGTQTRDFVHVRDVARGVVLALMTPSLESTVLNIASGTETSLNNLVSVLRTIQRSDIEVNYLPARAGDIHRSVADISRAKSILNFTTVEDFELAIRELLS